MSTENPKKVLGVRVYDRVKNELQKRATKLGQTASAYAGDVLTKHCEEETPIEATILRDLAEKSTENMIEAGEWVQLENNRMIKQLKELLEGKQVEVDKMRSKYNELTRHMEKQDLYSKQLEERLQNFLRQESAKEFPLELADEARFNKHLKKLQQRYPQIAKEQLIELAISCVLHNETSFFVRSLREHLRKNPKFFTSKSVSNETNGV